ncbi:MAG: 1-(5-phosphoribosyl)-5-[(5-phosphoribosylamino)methylideneamino]imidazole-4-carboxamide isomerase [Acholeplasmatales bacterium]|nr:1-(5-phosphoribosyl)-5-[(5-phosphoribosylamino)methylideneamino]imidazole-4-carboxamide isomerase [Acholeplasmatales bacterium]
MKLYPAIDLHEGRAVRLFKGDYNQVTDYGNPVEQAKRWKNLGAKFLHLVDLDGAKDGGFKNLEAVKNIIKEVDIDVELGGGIRSLEQIETLISIGVKRVILGSSALNLDFVKSALDKYGPEKIVIGIDCKNMMVATHGWLNTSNIEATDFAGRLKALGIKTIIFTDIAKDGTLEGINVNATRKMVECGLDVVASGGAKSLNDIEAAKKIGCVGIILGKSIYNGDIDLLEAVKKYQD